MSSLRRVLLLVVAAPLGSCATAHREVEPALPPGHNFSYLVPSRENLNLIQAFDDGAKTYLQFRVAPSVPIEIKQESNDESVPYTAQGRYVIVPGVYETLLVTIDGASTTIINQAPSAKLKAAAALKPAESGPVTPIDQARANPMSAVFESDGVHSPEGNRSISGPIGTEVIKARAVAVGVPESLQTMNANLRVAALKQEIWTLEEKVRLLSAELEDAHRAGNGASLYIRNVGGSPRVVLKFDDNSFATHVDDVLLDPLGRAARAANRIYLHGHTDAYVASDTGTELAIRRAVEVRRLLMSLNVEAERIRLFYRGAGNFVANNSTPEVGTDLLGGAL
jgi:Conjugal transfer protein/OmpA family